MKATGVTEKIILSEETKSRIIQDGKRTAVQRKKRMKMKYGICAMLLIGAIIALQSTEYSAEGTWYPVKVYAQEESEKSEINLDGKSTFLLEKEETPLGWGYVLYAAAEEGYHCKTVIGDMEYGLDTIFRGENYIYWIPDYWKNGRIRVYDEKGNPVESDDITKDQKARVTYQVYDEKETLRFQMTIQLREEGDMGVGEIVELISYPEQGTPLR